MEDKFMAQMARMEEDPRIKQMRKFAQHNGNTTYQHCKNVAMGAYQLANFLHLHIDGKALAVGAMLHDYYLYNTSEMEKSDYEHGVRHPRIALENAEKDDFALNDRERNIILSHMWPLTLRSVPKGKEAALVCIVDKYCAALEMYRGMRHRSQAMA